MEAYIARWVHGYLTTGNRIRDVIADTPTYVDELLALFPMASHEEILRAHEIAAELISADRAVEMSWKFEEPIPSRITAQKAVASRHSASRHPKRPATRQRQLRG